MNIDTNSNIASSVASSLSKLNLNTNSRLKNNDFNNKQEIISQPVEQEEEKITQISQPKIKNGINVDEIKQYASMMGENITLDDINYGLMYGRSVIADYSA